MWAMQSHTRHVPKWHVPRSPELSSRVSFCQVTQLGRRKQMGGLCLPISKLLEYTYPAVTIFPTKQNSETTNYVKYRKWLKMRVYFGSKCQGQVQIMRRLKDKLTWQPKLPQVWFSDYTLWLDNCRQFFDVSTFWIRSRWNWSIIVYIYLSRRTCETRVMWWHVLFSSSESGYFADADGGTVNCGK